MKTLQAADPNAAAKLEAAIAAKADQTYSAFLDGITRYQHSPITRDVTEPPSIWNDGTTRLLDFGGEGDAVLIIPSLVNRYHVLDIDTHKSFARSLAAFGFHVYVIDWDAPGEKEKDFALDDYMEQRLFPVLHKLHETQQKPVHLIGYCMGGLLAVALAQLKPAQTKSLICLATPWDFHAGDTTLPIKMRALLATMKDGNEFPVDTLQSFFFMQQPFVLHDKFVRFSKAAEGSTEERAFVLIEDWVNDGVPLATKVAHGCIEDWYIENAPHEDQWRIADHAIRPRFLNIPSLHVLPQHDKIVPPASAAALFKAMPHADSIQPSFGHISMMVHTAAHDKVWPNIFEWLASKR